MPPARLTSSVNPVFYLQFFVSLTSLKLAPCPLRYGNLMLPANIFTVTPKEVLSYKTQTSFIPQFGDGQFQLPIFGNRHIHNTVINDLSIIQPETCFGECIKSGFCRLSRSRRRRSGMWHSMQIFTGVTKPDIQH